MEREKAKEEAARITERIQQLDLETTPATYKKSIKDWTMNVYNERLNKIRSARPNVKTTSFIRKEVSARSFVEPNPVETVGNVMPMRYQ